MSIKKWWNILIRISKTKCICTYDITCLFFSATTALMTDHFYFTAATIATTSSFPGLTCGRASNLLIFFCYGTLFRLNLPWGCCNSGCVVQLPGGNAGRKTGIHDDAGVLWKWATEKLKLFCVGVTAGIIVSFFVNLIDFLVHIENTKLSSHCSLLVKT